MSWGDCGRNTVSMAIDVTLGLGGCGFCWLLDAALKLPPPCGPDDAGTSAMPGADGSDLLSCCSEKDWAGLLGATFPATAARRLRLKISAAATARRQAPKPAPTPTPRYRPKLPEPELTLDDGVAAAAESTLMMAPVEVLVVMTEVVSTAETPVMPYWVRKVGLKAVAMLETKLLAASAEELALVPTGSVTWTLATTDPGWKANTKAETPVEFSFRSMYETVLLEMVVFKSAASVALERRLKSMPPSCTAMERSVGAVVVVVGPLTDGGGRSGGDGGNGGGDGEAGGDGG